MQKRIEENRRKLVEVSQNLYNLSKQRQDAQISENVTDNTVNLLTKRQADALGMQNGIDASNGEDNNTYQEDGHNSTAVLLGCSIPVKNAVRPIKLPEIKRLPPYTTWIFLDRFVDILISDSDLPLNTNRE